MKAEETSTPEKEKDSESSSAEEKTESEKQADEPPVEPDPLEPLKEELRIKEEDLTEAKNNYLLLKAETDNFRKRLTREKGEFAQFANERLIKNLIPIYANLELALSAPSPTIESLKEGVEMILKQFASFLEKEKVETIKSLGEKFDPSKHEVLSQVESDEHEENTIIQEYSKGYYLNGRILQSAKVVISKLPSKAKKVFGKSKKEKHKSDKKKSHTGKAKSKEINN